jgi:hypothetical protein
MYYKKKLLLSILSLDLISLFFFHSTSAPTVPGTTHYLWFTITLRNTLVRTSLDEWSARNRDHYLTTHNSHKTVFILPLKSQAKSLPHSHTNTHTHARTQTDRQNYISDSLNTKVFRQPEETTILRTEWYREFPAFNLIFIPSRIKFWFGGVFGKKTCL